MGKYPESILKFFQKKSKKKLKSRVNERGYRLIKHAEQHKLAVLGSFQPF